MGVSRDYIEMLDEAKETFIDNIGYEIEHYSDDIFDEFGFQAFGNSPVNFHRQVYFQSYLESYLRKMITGILKWIADYNSREEFQWLELGKDGIFYNGYTNLEYERDFMYEFINIDRKIGYRYTSFQYNKIDELLSYENVESIVVISWKKSDEYVCCDTDGYPVKYIHYKELFKEVLFEDEDEKVIDEYYELFEKYVFEAMGKANELLSLVTIPGFSGYYLNMRKKTILHDLRGNVNGIDRFIVKNKKFEEVEKNSESLLEKYDFKNEFINKGYLQAFVGRERFAKSFMTSDYLFQYFNRNKMFDYTPVVSGYLKSIEQLLGIICDRYQQECLGDKDNKLKKYTLGQYEKYIKEHDNILASKYLEDKNTLLDCLESYRISNRNHLFHKHYLDKWDNVEIIKNNTIFLYIILLGMVDTKLLKIDNNILGVLDEEYDRLFELLDKSDSATFSITVDGKKYEYVRKNKRYERKKFNIHGQIINKIVFIDIYSEDKIEISRNNLPDELWYADLKIEDECIWKDGKLLKRDIRRNN